MAGGCTLISYGIKQVILFHLPGSCIPVPYEIKKALLICMAGGGTLVSYAIKKPLNSKWCHWKKRFTWLVESSSSQSDKTENVFVLFFSFFLYYWPLLAIFMLTFPPWYHNLNAKIPQPLSPSAIKRVYSASELNGILR